MQDGLCEIRFDIPLAAGGGPLQFERGWRHALAAQKLTALATPPAEAVAARFRLCGTDGCTEEFHRYLSVRLSALPGAPSVAAEDAAPSPDWQGVRVWLSYRAQDLPALLRKSKKTPKKPNFSRGRSS